MSILQVIQSRERDLGGFVVRRVLPFEGGRMIGPFIFFDHLGPADFAPGSGIDVRPHPHIALATVTYLFDGSLEHRDSLGNVLEIRPGDVNWMTAGHGITHSERTSAATRAAGFRIHGIQSWVALPDGREAIAPAFAHHPSATLPTLERGSVLLTIIAGSAYGRTSPVATLWPTLYVDARVPDAATLDLPPDHAERALYVVDGAVAVEGRVLQCGELAIFESGRVVVLRAVGVTRLMLLGGEKFPTARHLWWNFVSSSAAEIEQAKARWAAGNFPKVPHETESIPLPTT